MANCNDDKNACNYMHEVALINDQVRFIDVGCNHTLDMSGLEPGDYDVTVDIVGITRNYILTVK